MQPTRAQVRSALILWIVKGVVFLVILAGMMLLAAGRFDWQAGWAFAITALSVNLLTGVILRFTSPDLLVERLKMRPGTKPWDRFLASALALYGPVLIMLLAGLEVRLRGLDGQVEPANWVGLALVLLGSLLTGAAMVANAFFSATVRIQSERGHRVVDRGPYRVVRHPGYAGMLVYFLSMPLALGSTWAWAGVVFSLLILFQRTRLEDRTLQEELPGYREYASTVRSRLIPGVW